MRKPVNVFAAYQKMIDDSKLKAMNHKTAKLAEEKAQSSSIRLRGQGGEATDYPRLSKSEGEYRRYDKREEYDFVKGCDNPNSKYSDGIMYSPFYNEKKNANTAKSGIFSCDEGAVIAALKHGAKTNAPIQSKLIPSSFYAIGLFEAPVMNIGMVDALTWQAFMGCDRNVLAILKSGYKPQKKYTGFNPITAAIESKNIEILKLVLAYPPIRELINDKDGFGDRPLHIAAKIAGIDPFEFAREVIKAGGTDKNNSGEYSALMLTLLRSNKGSIWTPNIFAEILQVADLDYKTKDGETVTSLAAKLNNQDAIRMIENYRKYGMQTINNAVLNNQFMA